MQGCNIGLRYQETLWLSIWAQTAEAEGGSTGPARVPQQLRQVSLRPQGVTAKGSDWSCISLQKWDTHPPLNLTQ